MSLKKFLLSRDFFKSLGFAAIITAAFILIILIWLSLFTRHGQARPVPDFYGLTMDEANVIARKMKVSISIIDSVYTDIVPRGHIFEQNPVAGFKVKKNRRVMLTINAFNAEMVQMPNLVGLSARQAYSLIESAGLVAGNPVYKPDLTIDFVLEQLYQKEQIEPGDSLQKGSEIILVLGKGLSNRTTPVPNLIGKQLIDAKSNILGYSLTLGTFNFDKSVKTYQDSLDAFVYKQNPDYSQEASLQLGSAVIIWLTTDSTRLPVDSTLINLSDTLSLKLSSISDIL